MFYRLRRNVRTAIFNRQIRDILLTPELNLVSAPLTIVSMVQTRDVPMYLLAIKSFYKRIKRGKVVAIVADEMLPHTRSILMDHIPGIRILRIEDLDVGVCQRGGTWERLAFLTKLSKQEYCIQLDSDTLPLAEDVSEIVGCIEGNRAFTLSDGFKLRTMREAAIEARATDGDYIGIVAERLFDQYSNCDSWKYIRGSSGLAGFSKGGFHFEQLEVFHQTMSKLVGPRWREWGTEQCGSNFAVANSPDPHILPFPEYSSFMGEPVPPTTKFLHFIGSHRFNDGFFARRAKREIGDLLAG